MGSLVDVSLFGHLSENLIVSLTLAIKEKVKTLIFLHAKAIDRLNWGLIRSKSVRLVEGEINAEAPHARKIQVLECHDTGSSSFKVVVFWDFPGVFVTFMLNLLLQV